MYCCGHAKHHHTVYEVPLKLDGETVYEYGYTACSECKDGMVCARLVITDDLYEASKFYKLPK